METKSFIDQEWPPVKVIIAMKGLPCTGKTRVAEQISDWAKRPVLYIDDFIGAPYNNNINIADSWEEAVCLQVSVFQQAFTTLCRVAKSQLNTALSCAVIKSSLSSTFELEQLIQLVGEYWGRKLLLIVECQVRNKRRWRNNFDSEWTYEKKWYRPRSWNDMEKAIDDHYDPQALANWDLHLQHLIQHMHNPPLVRRLVVDPYYDLNLQAGLLTVSERNPIFVHAIKHLISASNDHQNPYVVEFDGFRRSRAKEVLNALTSSTRSKDLCGAHGCLFKYREELRGVEVEGNNCCGVCEQKVVSGQPGYTCHYCILTLHKSCAELIHFDFHNKCSEFSHLRFYISQLPASKKHACKGCTGKRFYNMFCDSCLFQTILNGRLLPVVVNHDRHSHPLSLRIELRSFVCKACGVYEYSASYVCRICEWHYHMQCIFMPKGLKHEHGGHEHVLELKYSEDDTEQEDYWCDICFEDLDPYFSFYSCKSCPYYASHLYCVGVFPGHLWQLRSNNL